MWQPFWNDILVAMATTLLLIFSYVGKYIANLERSYKMLLKLQPVLLQPCILEVYALVQDYCSQAGNGRCIESSLYRIQNRYLQYTCKVYSTIMTTYLYYDILCVAMNTKTSDFCPLSPVWITEIAVWITENVLYRDILLQDINTTGWGTKNCTCDCCLLYNFWFPTL